MLNVVHRTDVENISGRLEEAMKGCGLTTKPLAALRPVGNSWMVQGQDSQLAFKRNVLSAGESCTLVCTLVSSMVSFPKAYCAYCIIYFYL